MLAKITTAVLLCLLTYNSYAENKIYASIGGGWDIPSHNSNTVNDSAFTHYGPTAAPSGESFFNLPAVNWENKYKQGINFNAAIGYTLFPSIRSDIEFVYQRFKRDIDGSFGWAEYDALSATILDSQSGIPMTPTSSFMNVYSLMTNGYYDFHNHTKWTPYISGGFGVSWIKSKATTATGSFTTPAITNATPTLQLSQTLSGSAFSWQFKTGVSYDYSSAMTIGLQYRLFGTSIFTAQSSSITTNPNSGPTTRRVFRIAQQSVSGLLVNSLEIQFKFSLI